MATATTLRRVGDLGQTWKIPFVVFPKLALKIDLENSRKKIRALIGENCVSIEGAARVNYHA